MQCECDYDESDIVLDNIKERDNFVKMIQEKKK